MKIQQYFSQAGKHPWEQVNWVKRNAFITDAQGQKIFSQANVEFPDFYSQQAVNIIASKYFATIDGKREYSLKQLHGRVIKTIVSWVDPKLLTKNAKAIFEAELTYILLHQIAAFNSPVWFNLGVPNRPQAVSACYIQSVDDNMSSIMALQANETRLFLDGSGSGTNFSRLRGSGERLSGGGSSSGPMAFIQGLDASSGAIKSGGKTRRAAKMVILDVDHPDILDFIESKVLAEDMAAALIKAGFNGEFNAKNSVYGSLPFQNANHSVRVTDTFMKAVENDETWRLVARVDANRSRTVKAREVWDALCKAAWRCGDPGLQFHDTTNTWHTCPHVEPIYASNPCSEFVFLDNTACNLASINLMNIADVSQLSHVARVMITAMETLVTNADYPTQKIKEMSYKYRPLGLGYANLGAKLMSSGLAYDSAGGRMMALEYTRLMHQAAYDTSADIAKDLGPFEGINLDNVLAVVKKHFPAESALQKKVEMFGVRNAQVTVLAPTGTIGFMMDCDTTGIEPCLAITSYKKLVGGGNMKIVNKTAETAARNLGWDGTDFPAWLKKLPEDKRAIFDCSLPDEEGRFIAPKAHVDMMSAVQPYLSGAISKTVNMPASSTVEEVSAIYQYAWKMGLKAIAIYRDGCKSSQPISAAPEKKVEVVTDAPSTGRLQKKMPKTRQAIIHKFMVGGQKGYLIAGMYPDGKVGEVFVKVNKQGSTLQGIFDSWSQLLSLAIQYGTPLEKLVDKLQHSQFEPAGPTGNKELPMATSLVDYIMRWLHMQFLVKQTPISVVPTQHILQPTAVAQHVLSPTTPSPYTVGRVCIECGSIMEQSGSCHRCPTCGTTSGCS